MKILTVGFALSFVFAFARWRFPQLPKALASAGLVISAMLMVVALMPDIRIGPASLILLGLALIAGGLEWHSRPVATKGGEKALPERRSVGVWPGLNATGEAKGKASLDMVVSRPVPPQPDRARNLPASFASKLEGRAEKNFLFQIRVYDQSAEARNLGRQLVSELHSAGWHAKSFGDDGGTRVFSGVLIEASKDAATSESVRLLSRALSEAGVPVDLVLVDDTWGPKFARVAVGSHL